MRKQSIPLILEYCGLFFVIPSVMAFAEVKSGLFSFLWIAVLLCLRWLLSRGYDIRKDWNWSAVTKQHVYAMMRWFLPFALFLLAFTWFMIPDRLWSLPRERPQLWMLVMIFYPLLSVVPQEIIFRSFFFTRYASLLTAPRTCIMASALAFGFAHIVLQNWVAVVLSTIGGVLFSYTYYKTRSLALVCIEHALYGCLIFTVGLGYYFYHGRV